MEQSASAMEDSDDNRYFEYSNKEELLEYCCKRLLELGFEKDVSAAFHEQFLAIEELKSLYTVSRTS